MTSDAMLIRAAEPRDLEHIHGSLIGLARHIHEEHKMKSTAADLRLALFGVDPPLQGLVAEIDSTYAGMSLFFPSYSTWFGRTGVYVQDIFVEPHFRGQHVGERLLQHIAALTRSRGGTYMRLAVDTQNFSAMRFYTRLGIVQSDTEQIHAAYGDAFEALADAAMPEHR